MADETVKLEASQPEAAAPAVESTAAAGTTPAAKNDTETVKVDEDKDEPTKTEDTKENGAAVENGDAEEKPKIAILKTTAKVDYTDKRQNVKFDPSTLPVTDDPSQIRAQIEFYFGDHNLPQDEFLWNLTGGPENIPVELKTVCSFKRMRRFQPYEAVVKALRESNSLNITGEEGKEVVSRKAAYDPSQRRNTMAVSVYVKGFGDEQPSTQFDIEAFFAKFGPVNAIRLRRTPEGLFKGSVFAEFDTPEHAKAFLALDPPPKWQGHDLKIVSKLDYVKEKDQLIKEGKLQPTESRPKSRFWEGKKSGPGGRGGRGGGNFRGRNNSDPNDWKARRDQDRKNGLGGRGGGRGRGRGGRGGRGGRDRNYGNNRDRDEKDEANDGDKETTKDEKKVDSPAKRPREDDGATEEPPAKKADTKEDKASDVAA